MFIIPNKLAFIAHPRTGSRTAWEALEQRGGVQVKRRHEIDLPSICDVRDHGGLVCCVRRNMFDVLVSWYHNIGRPMDKSPQAFGWWLQTDLVEYLERPLYHYGWPECDAVLRFEHLQEDFDELMGQIGEEPVELGHIGATDRVSYREYYTPESRTYAESRWAQDFTLTGYKW